MKRNDISEESFEKVKVIDMGHFEKTFLVRKKDENKYYTMKEFEINGKEFRMDEAMLERNILAFSSHPYIADLRYAFRTLYADQKHEKSVPQKTTKRNGTSRKKKFRNNKVISTTRRIKKKKMQKEERKTFEKAYLFTPLSLGGELYFWLSRDRRFSEERAKFYAAEVFSVLDYLHHRGIVYCELKPESICLDSEGHITFHNFLNAFTKTKKIREPGRCISDFCGSPEYLSPEVILGDDNFIPSFENDMFSLGILLYEMVVGITPYYNEDVNRMYENIIYKDVLFPKSADCSRSFKDIVRKLLVKDMKKRLGCNPRHSKAKRSLEVRNHPFFKGIDWKLMESRKLKPSFVPQLDSVRDTRYIDSEFLSMPLHPENRQTSNNNHHTQVFQGFTFNTDGIHTNVTNQNINRRERSMLEEEEETEDYSEDLSRKKTSKAVCYPDNEFYYDWKRDRVKKRFWREFDDDDDDDDDNESLKDMEERSRFLLDECGKFIFRRSERKCMTIEMNIMGRCDSITVYRFLM